MFQFFVPTYNPSAYVAGGGGRGFLPSNEDDVCLPVQNAENVTEILGMKMMKVKENTNPWLMSTE